MRNRYLLATVALAAITLSAGSALAFHCPADMAKIDAALGANPQVTAEQMSAVKKLRDDGESMHKQGKHQEAVDALAKAMEILGMK